MNKRKNSAAAKIREYLRAHPTATPKEIAKVLSVTAQYVSLVKCDMKKAGEEIVSLKSKKPARAVPKKWKTLHISTSDNSIEMIEPASDPVNHPAHYKVGGIETIDFIEAKRLNYNLGNAVKYITRADHKGNRKQDLEKAIWYLKRELDHSM
jgi:hypothetical protein